MTGASHTQRNNHAERATRESAETAGRRGATMKEPEVTGAKWLRVFGEVLREQGKVREAILCQHYADKPPQPPPAWLTRFTRQLCFFGQP
jgi:hypothetical protein